MLNGGGIAKQCVAYPFNHLILELCFQYISSCLYLSSNVLVREISVCYFRNSSIVDKFPYWSNTHSFSRVCLSWKIFPNYSLFHFSSRSFICLRFSWKTNIFNPSMGLMFCRHSWIFPIMLAFVSHNCSNPSGHFKIFLKVTHERQIGQCSKSTDKKNLWC